MCIFVFCVVWFLLENNFAGNKKVSTFALAFEEITTAVVLKKDSKARQIKIFQKKVAKNFARKKKGCTFAKFSAWKNGEGTKRRTLK